MVNDAHATHLATDSLKHTRGEAILFAKRRQNGQEFTGSKFQLDKDGQKDLMVILVTREQDSCKLIQALDAGNLVVVHVDLGAWHIFHPHLFLQNRPFEEVVGLLPSVKTFQAGFVWL